MVRGRQNDKINRTSISKAEVASTKRFRRGQVSSARQNYFEFDFRFLRAFFRIFTTK